MAFEFDILSERTHRKLAEIGPNPQPYWDGFLKFLTDDPQGQTYLQILAVYGRRGQLDQIIPVGYPEIRMVGFSNNAGHVENIKTEFGIVGVPQFKTIEDLNPAKPADIGIRAVSYFGSFFALFKPGSKIVVGAD